MWFYRGGLGEHATCRVVFINGGRARSPLPTMGLPGKLVHVVKRRPDMVWLGALSGLAFPMCRKSLCLA
jgi:hypothetical protein